MLTATGVESMQVGPDRGLGVVNAGPVCSACVAAASSQAVLPATNPLRGYESSGGPSAAAPAASFESRCVLESTSLDRSSLSARPETSEQHRDRRSIPWMDPTH